MKGSICSSGRYIYWLGHSTLSSIMNSGQTHSSSKVENWNSDWNYAFFTTDIRQSTVNFVKLYIQFCIQQSDKEINKYTTKISKSNPKFYYSLLHSDKPYKFIIKVYFINNKLTHFCRFQRLRIYLIDTPMQQKSHIDDKKSLFSALGQQSPEIKPESPPLESIDDMELQNSKDFRQKPSRGKRRNKLKAKQTKLIKIRAVQNEQNEQNFIQKSPNFSKDFPPKVQQLHEIDQQVSMHQKDNKTSTNQLSGTLDSPVLYKISDQEDNQNNCANEQDIPQSSRRPLSKNQNKMKQFQYPQLQSPVKLLRSPRKVRNKQENVGSCTKKEQKIPKITNQDFHMQQKRQSTQVYEYSEQPVQGEEISNTSSQSFSGEQSSDERQSQQDDSQRQQQLQRPSKINQLSKSPAEQAKVTIFKSNSFYTLINAEIPPSNFVNCIIKRKRGEQYFQKIVTYQCYLLEDKKYLMTCIKNRLFKTTSHFQFYRQKNNHNTYNQQDQYAFLDSNFTGTEFVLKTLQKSDTNSERSTTIDKGESMKINESDVVSQKTTKGAKMFSDDSKNLQSQANEQNKARQSCYISFKTNFFGLIGQRQVKLLKKKNKKLKKTGNFSDLKASLENGQIDKFFQFNSKKAQLGKNGLQLDFKGVAKMQSTKNIILQNQGSEPLLIFGKVKEDIYSVAIGHPLSILEGLAFGVANLDKKFFVN